MSKRSVILFPKRLILATKTENPAADGGVYFFTFFKRSNQTDRIIPSAAD